MMHDKLAPSPVSAPFPVVPPDPWSRRRLAVRVLTVGAITVGCAAAHDSEEPVDAALADVSVASGATDATSAGGKKVAIRLPRDEGPHPAPREWWYYTGNVVGASARYGFEMVVFRSFSGGTARYLSHAAVTDVANGSYTHDLRISLSTQLPQPPQGFSFSMGGWTMSGHAGSDTLRADLPGYALDFALATETPAVLEFGDGLMTMGSTAKPFYYYSYPRMRVSGTLDRGAGPVAVTGDAWMDHQWGEIGADVTGWRWYSLRLAGGVRVMMFQVQTTTGPGFVGGTWIRPDGTPERLAATDVQIASTGTWTSPHTQVSYPQGWTLDIPAKSASLSIAAVVADQEFTKTFPGAPPPYWEGLCDVQGTVGGRAANGTAYVEIVAGDP